MSVHFATVIAVLVSASLGTHGFDVYEDGTIEQSLPGKGRRGGNVNSCED